VNYEAPVTAPQSDEALQAPFPPAQDEENKVSHFPFQRFDDTLFYDLESEEEMEPLDELGPLYLKAEDVAANIPLVEVIQTLESPAQEGLSKVSYFPFQNFNDSLSYDVESKEVLYFLTPSCFDKNEDFVDDIDEFIHVGKRNWDVIIYDNEGHPQRLPLHLPHEVTNNFDIWQQELDLIQTPKDDLMLCFRNDFRSYLEDFDDCSSEHLDLFYEDGYLPPLCSSFDRNKAVVCLKRDSHDIFLQPPLITLPCCIIKGVVGNYIFCIEFSLKQTQESKGWLKTTDFSLSSHFFNFPLRVCQSSARSLSIPSQASEREDILRSQFADLLSQYSEPWTFHDSF
jgi:hypothetical protein